MAAAIQTLDWPLPRSTTVLGRRSSTYPASQSRRSSDAAQVPGRGIGRDIGTSRMKDGSVVRDIEISITNRNTQSERSVRYREIWRWDDKAGRWWQTTGLPDFWDGQ